MIELLSSNPYVPWDVSKLSRGAQEMMLNFGDVFTFLLMIFLGIMGIFVVKNLVSYFLE